MSELKKMRAQKYKNKQRYKNKSKVVPKSVEETDGSEKKGDETVIEEDSRLFQKRGLESNWYRYDAKDEDVEEKLGDFSLIASAPISQGSYFQFKSDKKIDDNIEGEQIANKIFELDLNLLSRSVQTIPFYVRCGIDEQEFEESDLIAMNESAKEYSLKYKEYLESLNKENSGNSNEKEVEKCDTKGKPDDVDVGLHGVIEKLLICDTSDSVKSAPDLEQIEKEENLEEWLDDILDD